MSEPAGEGGAEPPKPHKRRKRYPGTHPRRFEEKYKELGADPEAMAKAKARGSTPAGAHLPIMVSEALQALAPLRDASVLDCTLGWGGHAEALAKAGAKVLALDRDGEELARTEARLKESGASIAVRRANYAGAAKVLQESGFGPLDGLLADLGVSSMQLDRPERGMSYKADGPLDMRMDRSRGETAAAWLARSTQAELAYAFARYGEEPDAKAIAAFLTTLAAKGRLPKTTRELVAAVATAKKMAPGRVRKSDASAHHPAARVFQAVRVVVNAEHEALAQLLRDLPYMMKPGGRAVLLTFHSLEEGLVRDAWSRQAHSGLWAAPPGEPGRPSPEEVRENPRARSARLWRAVRAAAPQGETGGFSHGTIA